MTGRDRSGSRLLLACLAALLGLLILVPASIGEGFGPQPVETQSRCAPMSISQEIVNIGAKIEADAGPATDACGGPAAKVVWNWENSDVTPGAVPGLVLTHPCAQTSTHCEYRARMFTQPGVHQLLCINGASPQGGFDSCRAYAVRYGRYHAVANVVNAPSGKPVTITLNGPGGRQTTRTSPQGGWVFPVLNGTYTLSYTVGRRHVHKRFETRAKPGTTVAGPR